MRVIEHMRLMHRYASNASSNLNASNASIFKVKLSKKFLTYLV